MSVLNLETIECRRSGGVAWLILNRPDALNAWTRQLGEELTQALDEVAADPEVRAIVLTGAGRAFSSGRRPARRHAAQSPRAAPDVRAPLRDVYHPLILRVRTRAQAGDRRRQRPGGGDRRSLALAADLIVAAAVGLLPDGVRQHRARPRRRRVADPRRPRRPCPRVRDRLPRRAHRRRHGAEPGGSSTGSSPTPSCKARERLAGRLAAGPPGSYAAIKRTINDRAYAGFAELLDLEADVQQERAESKDFARGRAGVPAEAAAAASPASSPDRVARRPCHADLRPLPMNLASILTDSAQRDPDHVAIKLDDIELSYAQLDGATAHLAGLLHAHGVDARRPRGDHAPQRPLLPRLLLRRAAGRRDRRADERAAQAARGRRSTSRTPAPSCCSPGTTSPPTPRAAPRTRAPSACWSRPGEFEQQVGAADARRRASRTPRTTTPP